jgi:hypothetical protein
MQWPDAGNAMMMMQAIKGEEQSKAKQLKQARQQKQSKQVSNLVCL